MEVLEQTVYDSARASVVVDVVVDGKPVFSALQGAVYLREPDRFRIRLYRFGVPVLDLLHRDGAIQGRPQDELAPLRRWIPFFLQAIFWWERADASVFQVGDQAYTFLGPGQRVWLDRRNLLPLRQEIDQGGRRIVVTYASPKAFDKGRFFPSQIRIQASSSALTVTIKKLSVGIPLEPGLFKPPA